MTERPKNAVIPRLNIPKSSGLSVYTAFLAGCLIFSLVLTDGLREDICALAGTPERFGAAALTGCVFLITAAYIASLSLAGRVGVPILCLLCGAFLSAVSGVIIPLCITQGKVLLTAACFSVTYIFVTLFLLVSLRSELLSRELNERCASDKRIRKHFLLLTALLIVSAVVILILILLLAGLLKDIIIR